MGSDGTDDALLIQDGLDVRVLEFGVPGSRADAEAVDQVYRVATGSLALCAAMSFLFLPWQIVLFLLAGVAVGGWQIANRPSRRQVKRVQLDARGIRVSVVELSGERVSTQAVSRAPGERAPDEPHCPRSVPWPSVLAIHRDAMGLALITSDGPNIELRPPVDEDIERLHEQLDQVWQRYDARATDVPAEHAKAMRQLTTGEAG